MYLYACLSSVYMCVLQSQVLITPTVGIIKDVIVHVRVVCVVSIL